MNQAERRANLVHTQQYINSLKGVVLVSCNARSLNTKTLLDIKLSLDCDFLCINESWMLPDADNSLAYWGGKAIYRNDRTYTTGGGLLMYVSHQHSPYCKELKLLDLMEPNIELQAIEFDKPTYKAMVIINVYRPPRSDATDFLEKLSSTLGKIDRNKYEVWVLGDININTRDRNGNETRELFDKCREHSIKRLIEDITRPNENDNGGTCLDQILTNCDIVSYCGVLNCMVADHYAVYACRKKPRETYCPTMFTGRSYKNYDVNDLKEYLVELNWEEFHESIDPDFQWRFIYENIIEYLDDCCPVRSFRIKKKSEPWVTRETIELINDRQNLLADYRMTHDRNTLRVIRRMRNRNHRQLEYSQNQFILRTLEECHGDPRRFWREVNAMVNPVTKNLTIQLENELTGEVIPIEETASHINNYYANIGQDLFSEMPVSGLDITDRAIDDNNVELDISELINNEVVRKLVSKINIDKSSGLEGVNSKVLKDTFMFLNNKITEIFTNSLKEGIFPASWSCGLLVPIPKKGNLKSVKNWRPITLLPLPGKLLEKIIHHTISEYLESGDVLCETQFGFRPDRGTADAVFHVVKDLFEARDDGLVTIACFIDFCKAFDCVHHPTLNFKFHVLILVAV